jgi:sensor domain CHASE-containing protein
MTDEIKARFERSRRDLESRLPEQLQRLRFMIARWEEHKDAQEIPIREHARRIVEQRAMIAMWNGIPAALP